MLNMVTSCLVLHHKVKETVLTGLGARDGVKAEVCGQES